MRASIIAMALALGVVATLLPARAESPLDCANAATPADKAACADHVEKAFASMLRDPAVAERTFRANTTVQAKIGLVMLLRLVDAEPQKHDAEIRKLLSEIAADASGDKEPIDFGRVMTARSSL